MCISIGTSIANLSPILDQYMNSHASQMSVFLNLSPILLDQYTKVSHESFFLGLFRYGTLLCLLINNIIIGVTTTLVMMWNGHFFL